jgi:hypothetical protein
MKTGEMSNSLGDELIHRDRISKTSAPWMRSRCEKADIRRMSTINIGMGHAAEDGKVVAMFFE